MINKWLCKELETMQTIRILCFGDYKIGKSSFLRKYSGDEL